MDWTSLVLGLVLGLGAGVLISRNFMISAGESKQIKEEAEQARSELDQYREKVSQHMAEANNLTDELAAMNKKIIAHMSQSRAILEQNESSREELPFFSKETTEMLKASMSDLGSQKSVKSEATDKSQPKDYSGQPSGLLADDSQIVTEAGKN